MSPLLFVPRHVLLRLLMRHPDRAPLVRLRHLKCRLGCVCYSRASRLSFVCLRLLFRSCARVRVFALILRPWVRARFPRLLLP